MEKLTKDQDNEVTKIITKSMDKGIKLGAWDLAKKINIIIDLSKAGDAITLDDIKMLCDDNIQTYNDTLKAKAEKDN